MILYKINQGLLEERMRKTRWWIFLIKTISESPQYPTLRTQWPAKTPQSQEVSSEWWTTSWQAIYLNNSITRVELVLVPTAMKSTLMLSTTMAKPPIIRMVAPILTTMTTTLKVFTWAQNSQQVVTRFRREVIKWLSKWKQRIMTKSHTILATVPSGETVHTRITGTKLTMPRHLLLVVIQALMMCKLVTNSISTHHLMLQIQPWKIKRSWDKWVTVPLVVQIMDMVQLEEVYQILWTTTWTLMFISKIVQATTILKIQSLSQK